jgi:predicted dinucleotide-binding enzyme
MRIGILGSGLIGGKLGTVFARAGHEVVFSYARTPGKLEATAAAAGPSARAGTPREAAENADAVVFAVPWWRTDDVLSQAGSLAGKTLVTCALPMDEAHTGLEIAHTWSGAEELARRAPGSRVVSAFGTLPSEVLFGVFARRAEIAPPSLLYCGDDEGAKGVAVELIRDAGFAPVDAGPLASARYLEPFTLLIARLAYEGEGGPELAYRFERYPDPAERSG